MRLAQGATSGTVAAATALVAAETPRHRVGWALGVVTSAVALGGAIGPVVGGLAGAAFGLRLVFLGGGILLLISTVPVLWIVRESERRTREGPRPSTLATIRTAPPGTIRSLAVLICAQGLVTVVQSASQILVVLKLIEMARSVASAAAGFAFGAAGLTNSVAAISYTRLTRRLGYVRTVSVAAVLLELAEVRLDTQDNLEARRQALVHCLDQLKRHSRELLERCYAGKDSIRSCRARSPRSSACRW